MRCLEITGPAKLSGSVRIQGAKNAAMKYVLFPLLTADLFSIGNVPNITSILQLAKITELLGGKVQWQNKHKLVVDTRAVKGTEIIPSDLFYFTSGAIFIIPILASRFGTCKIETKPSRQDTGGDQIGTRTLEKVAENLKDCGFSYRTNGSMVEFRVASHKVFEFTPPNRSFGASLLAVLSALFKKGQSRIFFPSEAAEFKDNLKFLQKAGVKIVRDEQQNLLINGGDSISGIDFDTMADKNDLATWIFASLITGSEISLTNLTPIEEMGIESLVTLLCGWKVNLEEVTGSSLKINLKKADFEPVNVIAGNPPLFHTDWQPLLAPLLTQLPGQSSLIDTVFTNRMGYWEQLRKLGAKYQFFQDPNYPEENHKPRAVRVSGPIKLQGAQVQAFDVRSGASLAIAALAAKGQTDISGLEQIERGYENFVGRLQNLGVKTFVSSR